METYLITHPIIMLLLLLWSLPWKGVALWKAAKNSHLKWFIFILVFSTIGVLEIIYIFFFSKKENRTNEQ